MSFLSTIMRDGLFLGRPFGIPVTANITLLPVALLILFSWSGSIGLPGALVALILFYGSIVAHEFGHALTARHFGIRTRSINLHFFGGVAQITAEPRRPAHEFWIAIAGPLVSLALFGLFLGLALMVPTRGSIATDVMMSIASLNLILALFNLLPGYPMDGGRLVRALLWSVWKDRRRATIAAARGGRLVGFGIAGLGILSIVGILPGFGFMPVLVGLFIVMLARAEEQRARMTGLSGFDPAAPSAASGAAPGQTIHVRLPDGREFEITRKA